MANTQRAQAWLTALDIEGRDERVLAATIRVIELTFMTALLVTFAVSYLIFPVPPDVTGLSILIGVFALLVVALWLEHEGRRTWAAVVLVGMTWGSTTAGIYLSGGLRNPGFSFMALAVLVAGLTLGTRAALITTALCALTSALVGVVETRGLLPEPIITYAGVASIWWIEMVLLLTISALVYTSMRRTRNALGDAERSEAELAERNRQLVEAAQQRQAAEAALRRSQKMEALGRLAGGIAHDFNNLLVVIQGYAQLLRTHPDASSQAIESAGQIEDASRRAAELTTQLLAFGRRQVQRPRVVDLGAVLRDAAGMLRRLVPDNVDIKLELEPRLAKVRVDTGQIHQVLLNLSANARDAMPGGGRLTFRTAIVEAHSPGLPEPLRGGGAVLLMVADTGLGMNEEVSERIFEPFFTTKAPDAGTGLGLASVYGIIEQCGGTIEVQSYVGEGTTFRIFFPSTSAALDSEPSATRAAAGARPDARVLVVEDQESVRRYLCRLLSDQGFHVTEAEDGESALERTAEIIESFDALVTDVIMPRVDGPELARRLRARLPNLCVLYTSGYLPDERVARARQDELTDFLPKPFSQDELVEKLCALLERRSQAAR